MRQLLPHIRIGTDDGGHPILVIDDYELFDFVEDYLTDECSIAYENRTTTERAGGEIITMHFPSTVTVGELESALLKLDGGEFERIYRLNNHVE